MYLLHLVALLSLAQGKLPPGKVLVPDKIVTVEDLLAQHLY
jgi:hypothetical protein